MMDIKENQATGKRIYFLDNLRTFTIFLVVLYHAGGVYESSGTWASFWIVDDPATNDIVGIINIILDTFLMPTLFFISGFLALMSLRRKNTSTFLKAKFKRLMVPWIIAVLTLIPLYKVIFLYSRNLPQESWSSYFHFSKSNISSQNWLWFLPILFAFNVIYAFLLKTKIKLPDISFNTAVTGSFLIGLFYSFVIGGIMGFRTWTHSVLFDFENERLLLYFLCFLLGTMCFQKKFFEQKPKSKLLYTIVNSIAWIPITLHIFARLIPFFDPEGFSVTPMYRLFWWLSFYFSLLCMLYAMVDTFRRYFDKTSKLLGELNRNSYYVYIIHVIVLGAIALALLHLEIPSLLKYFILVTSTYITCNLIISLFRKAIAKVR